LTLHVQAQIACAPHKEFVVVGAVVVRDLVLDAVESVNVELSLEGSVFGLVEVLGHDDLGEHLGLVDLEGLARGQPGNDVLLSEFVDISEY